MDSLRVAGLDGEVLIHRDEWGIPHIRAETPHDAFYGQGFVQAQDRLGQLEYDRRRARGRWAEVAGAGALAFDVFARRCGLAGAADREVAAMQPEARGVLEAFSAGVNGYLTLGPALPPDLALAGVAPDPWSPEDCCAVFLVRHVVFANWQKKLWRGRLALLLGVEAVARIEGADPRAVPLIVPPPEALRSDPAPPDELEVVLAAMAVCAEPAAGSNSWALDGTRTASGRPLVAGDPHRALEVPGVYTQGHVACPEFDAVGLSFVGVPGFPHFGHSAHVAWCVTNAQGDYQDLYVESGDAALHGVRHEVVGVRDQPAVEIACHETPRGPVIFGDPDDGPVLALRSTALAEPSTGLTVLEPMLRARSVDQLDDVMQRWVDPVNNLVSADVDGNIAYRTVGQIPIRDHANLWGPVPAAGGVHDWRGVIPPGELPRVRNPDGGLLVTANQRIVGPSEHPLGVDYTRPDRAQRLHQRLDGLRNATVRDMASVHRDRIALSAEVWVPRLCALEPVDEWERDAQSLLLGWDHSVDVESSPAAIYVVTRDAVCRAIAHDPRLAPLRVPFPDEPLGTFQPLELRLWALSTGLLAADDNTLLPAGRAWADVLAAAFSDAIGILRTALGDDVRAWEWGALHRAAPRHPLAMFRPEWGAQLDPPAVAMGGEWDTVMCAAHPAGYGFGVTSTSVARYVFDVGDWDRSRWIVPLGVSGDSASPHFADQQTRWARGELIPMRYGWDEIAARASSSTRLSALGAEPGRG